MTGAVATLAETAGKPNVASPHDRVDGEARVIENASVDAVAAAGSIWAGVADMARWARFMIDSGRVDGKRLLTPGTWSSLLAPQVVLPPSGFYPSAQLIKSPWNAYARGWFMTEYGGYQLRFHTGSIAGMVAIIGIIPEARFGVYVRRSIPGSAPGPATGARTSRRSTTGWSSARPTRSEAPRPTG